jgi:hypothetical protein
MQKHFTGRVTNPPDMIEAARKSLTPERFEELMRQTGGRPPTADELCAAVERPH